MEVEYSIDMLGYLVMWLFGELYCMFTKLLVIVSIYRRATLQRIIRPWLIYIKDVNQPGPNNSRKRSPAINTNNNQ